MQADPPGLNTISRTATRLDTSRRSVYRLHDLGLLPFTYIGPASPRVREVDLAALIDHGPASPEEIEQLIRDATSPIRRRRPS